MQKIYTETFFLSAGEANAQGEMSLPLLVSKFIDIATAHANSLHFGNPDMAEHHAGWVLSRIALRIDVYPKANEKYSISTWVERWTRRFSVRCFMLSDANGQPLGYARSVWFILSTNSHESLPLTIFDFNPELITADKCPTIDTEKHCEIDAPAVSHYTFQYCDLDFYRHVNTVRYVSLLLNQFSLADMDSTTVTQLEMSFMQEGKYGEEVEVRRQDVDNLSTLLSLTGQDGTNILFARIIRHQR